MKATVVQKLACRKRKLHHPGLKLALVLCGIWNGLPQMAHAAVSDSQATSVVTTPSSSVQSQPDNLPSPEKWAAYGQFTNVTQQNSQFHSPYSGDNSLDANGQTKKTNDLTLFAGLRLGRNTEFWANPEIDQGFGLSNTLGVAGFPSGEAYKVGSNTPYLRLPRAFVRHEIPLGGTEEKVEPGANQLAGSRASDNITLTVGKFSVVDIFDTNSYAHDPRADFLNWSVIDAGAFDYAADSLGIYLWCGCRMETELVDAPWWSVPAV